MSHIMNISACNISQTIGESSRFLFHVFLVHICTCVVEGKSDFFSESLFRSLLVTALAITLYHVVFRKIIEPKIEKMKLICYKGDDRYQKKKDIHKEYFSIDEQQKEDHSEKDPNDYSKEKRRSTTIKGGKRTSLESPRSYSKKQHDVYD
jgi:hypothetical protein